MSVEGDNTENEANVDLKGVIKDLADQIEKLTKIVEKSSKQIKANTSANTDWHKYQSLMKIELEKEHGRQVRLNKEYGRSSASLQMFTGLLTKGATAGFAFNKLDSHIGGVSKELDKLKSEQQELNRMNEKFTKELGENWRGQDSNRAETDVIRRQEEKVREAKESSEKAGGSKLAEGISSMKEFANKHKTGILIGAGSVGILLTVLKKAFDVSPMFQAIKKLLQFGFMLILRPIGDFFGFIMRPIMVMMLRKFIIPWYKDVYPVMKKLGTWIGNQVVPFIEDVASFFSTQGGQATTAGVAAAAVTAAAIVKKIKTPIPEAEAAGKPPSPKVPKVKTPSPVFPAPVQKTLPPAITKTLAKVSTIPAVIKSGVTNAIAKTADKITKITAPITKTLANPKLASAAADVAKFAPKILKVATRAIPVVGTALLGIDAAGSALKHFAPDQYEGVRQGGLALGAMLGDKEGHATEGVMDFFGFGKQSTAEQVMGGIGWAKDKIGMTTAAAGIGGGAGDARARNNQVIINIDHVSNEADIQRMGNVMQERLQESNKRTVKSY